MIESILYLIQSVSGYVEATEDTYIPAILAMFPKIPSHHLVSQTALLMIGKYMHVTYNYTSNDNIYEKFISFEYQFISMSV